MLTQKNWKNKVTTSSITIFFKRQVLFTSR